MSTGHSREWQNFCIHWSAEVFNQARPMKHLLLILFLMVLGYILWTIADKRTRKKARYFVIHHGIPLGTLVLVLLLLLAAAVILPALNIL